MTDEQAYAIVETVMLKLEEYGADLTPFGPKTIEEIAEVVRTKLTEESQGTRVMEITWTTITRHKAQVTPEWLANTLGMTDDDLRDPELLLYALTERGMMDMERDGVTSDYAETDRSLPVVDGVRLTPTGPQRTDLDGATVYPPDADIDALATKLHDLVERGIVHDFAIDLEEPCIVHVYTQPGADLMFDTVREASSWVAGVLTVINGL